MVSEGPSLEGREKALEAAVRMRGVLLAETEEKLLKAEEASSERGLRVMDLEAKMQRVLERHSDLLAAGLLRTPSAEAVAGTEIQQWADASSPREAHELKEAMERAVNANAEMSELRTSVMQLTEENDALQMQLNVAEKDLGMRGAAAELGLSPVFEGDDHEEGVEHPGMNQEHLVLRLKRDCEDAITQKYAFEGLLDQAHQRLRETEIEQEILVQNMLDAEERASKLGNRVQGLETMLQRKEEELNVLLATNEDEFRALQAQSTKQTVESQRRFEEKLVQKMVIEEEAHRAVGTRESLSLGRPAASQLWEDKRRASERLRLEALHDDTVPSPQPASPPPAFGDKRANAASAGKNVKAMSTMLDEVKGL